MVGFRYRNFALPPNLLRLFEILFSIIAVSLVTGWHGDGLSYFNLNRSDFNVVHNIQYFAGVATLTIICGILFCLIVLTKPVYLSPIVDLVVNAILCLLFLIAAIAMCESLSRLGGSTAVKEARLTFTNLEGAVAFGFMTAISLGGSSWFAFLIHRRRSDLPLNQSHSNADLPGDIPT